MSHQQESIMSTKYHKIQTMFHRDPNTNYKTLILDQYSRPEFEYLADSEWLFTEKINGTNIRVIWKDGQLTFGGRTDNAQIPSLLVNKLNERFTPESFGIFDEGADVVLYGEGYGAKIQKGGGNYISDGVDFILFDVLVGDVWLERDNVEDIANKLSVFCVPVIGYGTLRDAIGIVHNGFLSQAANNPDHVAEGLVIRPMVGMSDRLGRRIITKLKAKDFVGVA